MPMPKLPKGLGDLGNVLRQAEKAMADAKVAEQELAAARVEGVSPGGHVKVVASGTCEIISISIAKDIVDPDDIDMLEDLVTAAVRDAVSKANKAREDRLRSTLPPGMGNLLG